MADLTAVSPQAPRAGQWGRGRLLLGALPLSALTAAGAATITGLRSLLQMGGFGAPRPPMLAAPDVPAFIDVPRLTLSLPGTRDGTLLAAITREVHPAAQGLATRLMLRLTNAFNGFLSDIGPPTLPRCGILKTLRAKPATRARSILGEKTVRDLFITECRVG